MTRYNLAPYQVRAALEKRLSIVTKGVANQPKPWLRGDWMYNGVLFDPTDLRAFLDNENPFPSPGKTFVGTETFARYQIINHVRRMDGRPFSEVSDGCIAYREDGYGTIPDLKAHIQLTSESDFEGVEVEFDRWQSPAVMKSRESRFLFTVVRRGVWRLGDGDKKRAIAEGYREADANHWINGLSLFPNPYFGYLNSKFGAGKWSQDHWQFYAEVSVEVRG
jgi:hypothetical protein